MVKKNNQNLIKPGKDELQLVVAFFKTKTLDVSWNFTETGLGQIIKMLNNSGAKKLVELTTSKEKKYR